MKRREKQPIYKFVMTGLTQRETAELLGSVKRWDALLKNDIGLEKKLFPIKQSIGTSKKAIGIPERTLPVGRWIGFKVLEEAV